MFDAIHRMCERFPQHIELARSPDDVLRIHKAGKLVACIGIENGFPMGEDLSRIEHFYWRGARYMGICHNGHNQLGDSHKPRRRGGKPLHGGLSELGRKAIAEMNRLGIMVDISHSAKTTMLQALAASKAPVIASHSGCAAVRPHGRNLDDEQLRALKKNGGVIQIVGLAAFIKDDTEARRNIAIAREQLGLPGDREIADMKRRGEVHPEVQDAAPAVRGAQEADQEGAPQGQRPRLRRPHRPRGEGHGHRPRGDQLGLRRRRRRGRLDERRGDLRGDPRAGAPRLHQGAGGEDLVGEHPAGLARGGEGGREDQGRQVARAYRPRRPGRRRRVGRVSRAWARDRSVLPRLGLLCWLSALRCSSQAMLFR